MAWISYHLISSRVDDLADAQYNTMDINLKDYEVIKLQTQEILAKQARALINKYAIPRNDVSIFDGMEYCCYQCCRKGIKTKYPVEEMLRVEYKNKTHGVTIHYYCKKHSASFIPHSQRVGNTTHY